MTTIEVLGLVLLGAFLGAAGQGARVIVGIKKEVSKAKAQATTKADWFDSHELGVSFVLGAVAGITAALAQYEPDLQITKSLLLAFAAAGYSGADFIGGLFKKTV